MKKMFKIILICLSCLAILTLGFYGFIIYSIKTAYITQILAKDIETNSNKIEITPDVPLRSKRRIQQIALSIDGYEPNIADMDQAIRLNNGTLIKPNIELVDESNDVHQLEIAGRKFNDNEVFVIFRDRSENSKNVSYKAVRINSDKSFRCSVYWQDYNMK